MKNNLIKNNKNNPNYETRQRCKFFGNLGGVATTDRENFQQKIFVFQKTCTEKEFRNLGRGNVLTLAVLIFTMASLALSLGIISPIVKHIKNIRGSVYSKQAFYTGESLQEDVLYRLRNGILVGALESMTLNGGTAEASISGTNEKTIVIDSDMSGYKRKISATLTQTEGTSFSYGIQVGRGGFEMGGSSSIEGSVYSNGDITGSGSSVITGAAIAATVPNPIPDQSNYGDLANPPYSIDFGGNSTPLDFAQGFQVSTTTPISSVHLYIKKTSLDQINSPTIQIVNDDNGNPGKDIIAEVALDANKVGTLYSDIEFPFASGVTLSKNTQYWLVIHSVSGSYTEHYTIGATSNTYANGVTKVGTWSSKSSGVWGDTSPSGLDAYFGIFISGDVGTIKGVKVGTAGKGDAWANKVENSTVEGSIYCQTGISNNKDCDTSRSDPIAQQYPVSDANIQDWKNSALAGGVINGDLKISKDTQTIGPKKIVGDLEVSGTLNISGYLWVTGNVSVKAGGLIKLASMVGEKSSVLITDGLVNVDAQGAFDGSGVPHSYVLVISTSNSDSAISVGGGTGAVVLNAQNGTVSFSGHSSAKQVTANKIIMSGTSNLIYEDGLMNVNFVGGPSGSWAIDSWQEFTQ